MNSEEVRILAGLFMLEAPQWIAGAWMHYLEKSFHEDAYIPTPRHLRLLFGDFRSMGTLNLRAAILQTIICLALLITLTTAWRSELTRDWVKLLIVIQFSLAALGVTVGRLLRRWGLLPVAKKEARVSDTLRWNELRDICLGALQTLEAGVIACWPDVKVHVEHHTTNPVFPLRLCGSFSVRADSDGIDISIDFKWGKGVVEVTADVCDETGAMFSEFPCQMIPLTDSGDLAESEALEIVRRVAAYVEGQSPIVCDALGESLNYEEREH